MKPVKESKKNILLIIILTCIGGAIGALSGKILDHFDGKELTISNLVSPLMANIIVYGFIAISVIAFIAAFVVYYKIKKIALSWDGENEEIIDDVEYKLNFPLSVANIFMVLDFIYLSIAMAIFSAKVIEVTAVIIVIAVFIIIMALSIVITSLTVNLERTLNPEKDASALELHFAQKWEDSSDEAEKLKLYEAGFRAYKVGVYTCLILFTIGLMFQVSLGTGLLPVLFVGIIWLTMTIAGIVAGMKLEKK